MDVDRSENGTRTDPTDEDVEATLRDARAFLDNPVALLGVKLTRDFGIGSKRFLPPL